MNIQIEHFENGKFNFTNEVEFISWTKQIQTENQDDDISLTTKEECVEYIRNYCENFEVISI